jgi:hypothetical protein
MYVMSNTAYSNLSGATSVPPCRMICCDLSGAFVMQVVCPYEFNPLKPRERERERKSIILLEGSQATPARPSGRNNVKVKTLW